MELFETLIWNYFGGGSSSKTKLLRFQPSKSSIFGSFIKYACLKEDYDAYKDSYETLCYAFGRFSDIDSFLLSEQHYDKEKMQLYKYKLPFDPVSYVNKTRLTSFEKNVNAEINESILNEVTNLSAKKEITNEELSKEGVYDFGNFIIDRLNALERSDNNLISEFSKNYEKIDQSKAKYKAYLAFGGKNDWTSWEVASNNYVTFKGLADNKTFYQNAIKNSAYITNISAQEKAAFLFNNNYDTIKYEYEGDSIKPFETNSISSSLAKSYISTHMGDQKRFVVKSPAGSEEFLVFNKEKTYQVIVPIDANDKSVPSKNRTGETFVFVSNKNETLEKGQFTVSSKNISEIDRSKIILNGNSYKLVDAELELTDGSSVTNEITKKSEKKVEANSYYNEGLKMYFKASDIIKKLVEIDLYFEIMPYEVEVDIKSYCVESSQWKQTCEKALNLEKEKRGKNVLRAVVDTIPYDPWETTIKKLQSLYYAFAKIQENKEGYILVPPNESDLEKAGKTTCKKCGKTKDKCECEDIKLCDKVFPVDIFGVTGLLGLDSLLSKFGLFNTKAFIMDEEDNKLTYSNMAEYLYDLIFYDDEEYDESDFSKVSDKSSAVLSLTFDDLKNSSEYDIEDSVARQFTEQDFKTYLKEYGELISKGDVKKLTGEYVSRELKVGIIDGYVYIPIGKSVTFIYNLMGNKFIINGTSTVLSLRIFSIINKEDPDEYISEAEAMLDSPELVGKEDAQKVLAYPYKPDILALLGQSKEDTQKELNKFSFSYMYIPTPESSKRLLKDIGSGQDIPITFDIYIKRPIKCGFPKKEKPKCKSDDSCGKCGLEELFKSPIEVGSVRFNPKKEMQNYKSKTIGSKMSKAKDDLIKNVKKMTDFACDIDGNLESLRNAKNGALDALYSFGKEFAPIMNMFPLKCLTDAANDGRNAICSASRQAQDKSVIDDFSQSVTHKLKTTEILVSQAWDAGKERLNKITSGLQNAVGPIAKSVKNLYDNASIYNLCPERFGDYINDSGIAKSFGEGLEGLMKTDILDVFKGILGNCMVDGIIDSTLGGINSISKNEIGNVKKILMSGDSDAIDSLGKKYPELLSKFGTSGGSGIDFNKLISSSTINTNFLQSFETELTKRLSPQSLMTSVKDKFTGPGVLIDFAKNGAKTLITGGPGDMATTLMNNAKGIGIDKLQGQLQGNLSSIFNSQNSKQSTNTDIISSMNNFIKEKADLYSQISAGSKIPNLDV